MNHKTISLEPSTCDPIKLDRTDRMSRHAARFPDIKTSLEPVAVNNEAFVFKPGNYEGIRYFLGVVIKGTLYYPSTQRIGQDYGISNRSLSLGNEGSHTLIYKDLETGHYFITSAGQKEPLRLVQTPQECTIPTKFLFIKNSQLMAVVFERKLFEIITLGYEWNPDKEVYVYGYTKKSRELILCIGGKTVLAKPADLSNPGPELGVVKRSGLVTECVALQQHKIIINRDPDMSIHYQNTDCNPVQFFIKYQSTVYCCDLGRYGVREQEIKSLTVLSRRVIVEEKNGGWKAVTMTTNIPQDRIRPQEAPRDSANTAKRRLSKMCTVQ